MSAWPITPSKCIRCGCELETLLDQQLGVCPKPQCRGAHYAEKRRAQEDARRETEKVIVHKILERLSQYSPDITGETAATVLTSQRVSLVPSCDNELCVLPEERLQKFTQHLDRVIRQANELLEDPKAVHSVLGEYSHRNFEGTRMPILPVINGCSTCRGYCCRNGGDTAFLASRQIAWQLLSDPTLTWESIRGSYLNRLPKSSVDDSCVYHTERGCALPRQERESICNDFHCWELQGVLATFQEGDENSWLAVAVSHDHPKRLGISKPGEPRVEMPFQLD